MPVKTDKKPVAKKPAAKPAPKAIAKPKAVEAPKPQAPKAQAPKPQAPKPQAPKNLKAAPKAEPKADKKKTISQQEFQNLCVERSYEIWLERSKTGKPGDQNTDWHQAVTELQKLYNVK